MKLRGSAFRKSKVRAPGRVVEGIEAVRDIGAVDDMAGQVDVVRSLAMGLGFPEVAAWVEVHLSEYLEGIEHGFEPDAEWTVGCICGWETLRER